MVAIGAMLGLSACSSSGSGGSSSTDPAESVYGPPPDIEKEIEQVEDVYGQPVEDMGDKIEPVETVYGPPPADEFDSTKRVEFKDSIISQNENDHQKHH